jgi:hypothetical protein
MQAANNPNYWDKAVNNIDYSWSKNKNAA